MADTMTADRVPHERAARESLRDWPGWDYVPGIASLVIGLLFLAEPLLASLAASIYVAVMFCVAGGFILAGGLARPHHRGGWLGILLGILSILAGIAMFYNPVATAVSLVWVIGAWFMVCGISELLIGLGVSSGRGWLILVGIIDVVFGGFVLMTGPAEAFAFLGYLVGISLIFRGMWSLLFTGELHKAAHPDGRDDLSPLPAIECAHRCNSAKRLSASIARRSGGFVSIVKELSKGE